MSVYITYGTCPSRARDLAMQRVVDADGVELNIGAGRYMLSLDHPLSYEQARARLRALMAVVGGPVPDDDLADMRVLERVQVGYAPDPESDPESVGR